MLPFAPAVFISTKSELPVPALLSHQMVFVVPFDFILEAVVGNLLVYVHPLSSYDDPPTISLCDASQNISVVDLADDEVLSFVQSIKTG